MPTSYNLVNCTRLVPSRLYLDHARRRERKKRDQRVRKGRWEGGVVTLLGGVKKITFLYMQYYNPPIPGCTLSRSLNGRQARNQKMLANHVSWRLMLF